MRPLTSLTFDAKKGRKEWQELDSLLKGKAQLDESKDILPFFKNRSHLSSLASWYFPKLTNTDRIAHEYPIYTDFRADLIVGDSTTHNYVLVEFEDGRPDSIFKKKPTKATPEWAQRFECAFSQLVDWMWKLDDMRSTVDFEHAFGDRQASFHGLIVIGKGVSHTKQESSRLKWRLDKVAVNSNKIQTVTFEELRSDFDTWLKKYHNV
ncbi:MAG TPA: Shedu immune nuclease family protein [Candidatus Sulfotelmatobacter sp.]|jgi:hypothetical protein|nr:Shedu immune nuclease family protein [Candidatus Sulfotelmatobacter sp.]